jgi:hypothetical protein
VADETAAVCTTCGQKLNKVCSNGHPSPITAKFCPLCGETMLGQAPKTPSTSVKGQTAGVVAHDSDPKLPGLSAQPAAISVPLDSAPYPGAAPVNGSQTGRRVWALVGAGVVALVLVVGIAVAATSGGSKTAPASSSPPTAQTGSSGRGNANSSSGGSQSNPGTSGKTGSGSSSGSATNTGNTGNNSPNRTNNSGNTGTGSQAGTPLSTTDLSSEGTSAMNVAQSLASALASHNWVQARSIFSGLTQSDDQLQSEYGGLDQSTVVVTSESHNGDGTVDLTGAYVAWETANGNQQTSVYCISWDVNPGSQQVVSQSADGPSLEDYQSGWADPQSMESVVTSQC